MKCIFCHLSTKEAKKLPLSDKKFSHFLLPKDADDPNVGVIPPPLKKKGPDLSRGPF